MNGYRGFSKQKKKQNKKEKKKKRALATFHPSRHRER